VFFGDANLWQQTDAVLKVSLPVGSWFLGVVHHDHDLQSQSSIWLVNTVSFFAAVLLSAFLLLRHQHQNKRRRLLLELQSSQLRLRAILDNNTRSLVYMKDLDGRYQLVNQAFAAEKGLTIDDILGRTDFDLNPVDSAGDFVANDQKVMESGELQEFEESIQTPLGERHFLALKFPMYDPSGQIEGICGISYDITERKRAELQLKNSQLMYQDLVENTHDWIWEVDADGRYTYVSPRIYDFLGYQTHEVMGKTPFDLMPEAEAERVKRLFINLAGQAVAFNSLENTNVHKDGHEVVLETSGTPMFDAEGKLLGYRGTDRDISERKKLERREKQQVQILEAIAAGQSLQDILHNLLRSLEEEIPHGFGFFSLQRSLAPNTANLASTSMPENLLGQLSQSAAINACVETALHNRNFTRQNDTAHGFEALDIKTGKGTETWRAWPMPLLLEQGDSPGCLLLLTPLEASSPSQAQMQFLGHLSDLAGIAVQRFLHQQIVAREETWRKIFIDESKDGIVVLQEDGSLFECNRAFTQMLGYELDTLMQKKIWEIDIHFDRADIEQMMKQVDETGLEFETRHRRADSTVINVEVSAVGVIYDEQKLIFCACRNITERKNNEQALFESREQFDLAMRAANDGLWDWNLSTNTVYFSPRWKSMLGYEDHELSNEFSTWEGLMHAQDLAQQMEVVNALIAAGRGSFVEEFRMRHQQGHWVNILSRGLLIANEEGKARRMVGTHMDISEHRAAEQALLDIQSQLARERDFVNAVVEVAGSIIIVMDTQHRIVRFNREAERVSGFSVDEVLGEPIWELMIPPEAVKPLRALFADLSQLTPDVSSENEWVCKDGSRRLIAWRNTVLDNDQGEIAFIVSQGFDITETRQTELALEEYRNQLEKRVAERTAEIKKVSDYNQMLFDTTPIGLALCKMDGQIVDVNTAYCDIVGYNEADVKQLSYWDLTPKEYEALEQRQLESIKTLGFYGPYEKEYRHKDGHRVPVLLNGLRIEMDGETFIWSTIEDMTERHAIEAKLVESEKNLARAQALAHLGSWHLDVGSGSLSWSDETYLIFAREAGSVTTTDDYFDCVHEDDREYALQCWQDALNQIQDFDMDIRIHAGATLKWIHQKAEFNFDHNGELQNVIGTVQDITDIKQAEAATRQALQEAHRLAQARSDFLANMSHEIRTPLNAVLGLAQVGYRDATGSAAQIFSQINESGENLLRVVNDVLDFSKLDAGKLSVENEPFDLLEIVRRSFDLMQGESHRKGLEYELNIDPEIPHWVSGDGLRLQQILANLLSNAIKFTTQGFVSLSLSPDQNQLQFSVTDSGIGIAKDKIAALFQPFEQADSSTTRTYGGTGLGLTISYQLANLMGGTITVESELNKGTCFNLLLPLPPVESPKTNLSSTDTKTNLQGYRILAAEDVALNRQLLQDMIEYEGALIELVENGALALEAVQKHGADYYDVILMDVQMPVMDGYTATAKIHAIAPALPVIGVTAHALPEEREKSLLAGMLEHISKPIHLEQLIRAIHAAAPLQRPEPALAVAQPALDSEAQYSSHDQPQSLPGIDLQAGLQRLQGRWHSYERILRLFLQQHLETEALLQEKLQQDEFAQTQALAHRLKGSSGNLGAMTLHQAASQLEQACREADEPMARQWLPQVQTALRTVLDGLLQHFTQKEEQHSNESAPVGEALAAVKDLQSLRHHLKEDLHQARQLLERLLKQHPGDSVLEPLNQALNQFDLDQCQQILNSTLEIRQREQ